MTTSITIYGWLRYTAILNVLVALGPASQVKGRSNDPLLDVPWWPHEYHSAVLVVVGTALIGLGATYVLRRLKVVKWWAYSLCAASVGAVPGLFYLAATPPDYLPYVPIGDMVVIGVVFGFPIGAVIGYLSRGGIAKSRA
jgi:hypothetical protein